MTWPAPWWRSRPTCCRSRPVRSSTWTAASTCGRCERARVKRYGPSRVACRHALRALTQPVATAAKVATMSRPAPSRVEVAPIGGHLIIEFLIVNVVPAGPGPVPGIAGAATLQIVTEILSVEARAFVEELNRRFRPRRDELLARRAERRQEIARTGRLDFLPETKEIRESSWQVPPPAPGLVDRKVEITGPTERKMTINALNSGAKVWLADFEDANTPHWTNVIQGQVNLYDAVRRTITYESPDGRRYELTDGPLPTIVMRPRGWHLPERHILVDDAPAVGALVDAGLYLFHNAREL